MSWIPHWILPQRIVLVDLWMRGDADHVVPRHFGMMLSLFIAAIYCQMSFDWRGGAVVPQEAELPCSFSSWQKRGSWSWLQLAHFLGNSKWNLEQICLSLHHIFLHIIFWQNLRILSHLNFGSYLPRLYFLLFIF